MFPAALITSRDSLLKGLNCRCCWRSRWSAFRWGWFSTFWIKSRTLASCNCFTAECGNHGMLKSMSSSLIARLNSLSVLNNAMSRFSSGANCSFTVCTWAVALIKLSWSIVSLLNTGVFRHITSFNHAKRDFKLEFFVKTFFIDFMGTGRCTLNNKHIFRAVKFPDRSQICLGFGWVSWENVACWTSPQDCCTSLPTDCCSTVEPNSWFHLVQSWSCLNEIFGGCRGDM